MKDDFMMGVGEGDVELAEERAFDALCQRRLTSMMRETVAEIVVSLTDCNDKVLRGFHAWLVGETTLLPDASKTFAGIVLDLCVDEIVRRFAMKGGSHE